MSSADPLSQIQAKITALLKADSQLAAVVRVGNYVDFLGTKTNPIKESIVSADTPALIIIPAGGEFNGPDTGVSSSSCTLKQRYSIGVVTEELRVNAARGINFIKWRVFAIMERARPTLGALVLTELDNVGVAFNVGLVNNLRITQFTDQTADVQQIEREIRGWKSVIGIEVTGSFTRTLLV